MSVEAITAIEDDALHCDGLGEILGGFGFTGACWSLWRTSKVELQSAHQRAITAISEGCDDETSANAEVLIPILEGGVDHLDLHGCVGRQVVAHLGHPLEVGGTADVLVNEFTEDVVVVDLEYDEGGQHHPLDVGGGRAHNTHNLLELLLQLRFEAPQVALTGHQSLHGVRKVHARTSQDALSGPPPQPLLPGLVGVLVQFGGGLQHQVLEGASHFILDLLQPLLHVGLVFARLDLLLEQHLLLLDALHAHDLARRAEYQLIDALETLSHVWLHEQGVSRLSKDVDKVIVGEEEESRELQPLNFQVVLEALLDLLDPLERLLQLLEKLWNVLQL